MSVNRIWFPNLPSNSINLAQRTQLAIGYSGIIIKIDEIIVDIIDTNIIYFRRYLQDTLEVQVAGPPITLPVGDETADTRYLRRYLQDVL